MEMYMGEFLQSFSMELQARRINPRRLQGPHVTRLIDFMDEKGITRLVADGPGGRRWFLASDGGFANPLSNRDKTGNIFDLKRRGRPLGCVFDGQNGQESYFRRQSDEGDTPINQGDLGDQPPVDQNSFGLERDLQHALRDNIAQLDAGLRIIDGDVERTVEAGRIDITAEDDRGNLVVIELKAGAAAPEAVAQLLGYMGAIENPDGRPIRGILVANDFHPNTVYAAKAVPNISLKAYSFQFSFEDR